MKYILFYRWRHRGDLGGLHIDTFYTLEELNDFLKENKDDHWKGVVPEVKLKGEVIE